MGVMEGSSQEMAGPHTASSVVRVDGLPAANIRLHGRLLLQGHRRAGAGVQAGDWAGGAHQPCQVRQRLLRGLSGVPAVARLGRRAVSSWALAAVARCTSPKSHSSTHPRTVWPTASCWSAFADYHPRMRRRRCASCTCGEPRGWAATLAQRLSQSSFRGGAACRGDR